MHHQIDEYDKQAELESARVSLNDIFFNSDEELGSWSLLGYQAFLKTLPERIRAIFEIQEGNRQLKLEDFDYDIPSHINHYHFVSEVKDKGGDLTVPLRARFVLYQDGKPVQKTKKKLVARVPFPTRDGNFVLGGTEFTVRKQLRLSPGVYTSRRHDGRIHAMLNTHKRQSADIYFDPDSNKFHYYVGGRQFPLHAVMNLAGVPENRMRKAWGEELYNANFTNPKRMDTLTKKLYSTMNHGRDAASVEDAIIGIREALSNSKFDPWVTNITLGKGYEAITPDMLIDTTRKMLRVSAGKEPSDNREGLHFKQPFDIGMMINYALGKARPRIQRKLRIRMKDRDDLDSIISRPLADLNKTIISKYNEDELSHTPDQYNPMGLFSDSTEVTLSGEGGLRSRYQITDEARGLPDSVVGFIDGLHSPEGPHLGINMHLARRAHLVGSKIITTGLIKPDGGITAMTPRDMYDKVIALPGQVKFKNGKPVLTAREIDVLHNGTLKKLPASKVDAVLGGNPSENFGVSALIPFINYNAGNRISTTIKQLTQAVPLIAPEAPLVRPIAGNGKTVGHQFYQKMNILVPKRIKSGTVTMVRKNSIYIKDDDGNLHKIPIREDYQLNGDASIIDKPIVKAGDKVSAGQVLTENQWSKDGELALGTNLDVAYIPFYGYNHQDGLVISESAARKLTSQHSYQNEFSNERGDVFNKKKFLAY